MPNNQTTTLVVRNKDKIIYSGPVFALTSVNDKGPFDILAEHENFISLIKEKVIVRTSPKEKNEIQITNGILRVHGNKVFVYVNFI
jgi:F0F1-type ATP synthase epsilon subunit